MLSKKEKQLFCDTLKEIRNSERSRFKTTKQYKQHGKTSVYRHSISVAYAAYRLAKKLHIPVNDKALLRGALLHDYFLYDWHVKSKNRPLHGFYHPKRALKNAEEDFRLNDVERDIIKSHMFPMTIRPPKYRESVLVNLADKWVSLLETLNRR